MAYYEKKSVPYDQYVVIQGRKANNPEKAKSFINSIPSRIKKFEGIFEKAFPFLLPGTFLCLGARTGCEIKAAINLGFDAEGIDLHPLDPIVVKGDWHNIPFPDNSFNNVYTNAVDHCYDAEKLAKEVRRVLTPRGIFFLQLSKKQLLKTKEDKHKYIRESANFLFWETEKDLADYFCKFGFEFVKEYDGGKWENFILKGVSDGSR